MGSGASGRRLAGPFRRILSFLLDLLALGAVARAGLPAVADALGVEGAADDLVADAGQVLHPAAADEHDRVLLQVVADARDVGGDLDAAGQADPAHLAQGRVGLLGRGRVDARADPPPLGRTLERRGLGLFDLALAALADQLGDRWQSPLPADCSCCSLHSTGSGVYSAFRPPCTAMRVVLVRGRSRDRAYQPGRGPTGGRAAVPGRTRVTTGVREARSRMVAEGRSPRATDLPESPR